MPTLKQSFLTIATLALLPTFASANTVVVPGNAQVSWEKSGSVNLDTVSLTDRTGAVVFIRPLSNNTPTSNSSTNIALNGQLLTSLQDGHYSVAIACAGDIQLSAVPTAAKINDLNAGVTNTMLSAGETQYFIVSTEANFTPMLQQTTAQQANHILQSDSIHKQSHLISRIAADNCQTSMANSINP